MLNLRPSRRGGRPPVKPRRWITKAGIYTGTAMQALEQFSGTPLVLNTTPDERARDEATIRAAARRLGVKVEQRYAQGAPGAGVIYVREVRR